eukprot:13799925-Alexandrium_andersonii.AAC.1
MEEAVGHAAHALDAAPGAVLEDRDGAGPGGGAPARLGVEAAGEELERETSVDDAGLPRRSRERNPDRRH